MPSHLFPVSTFQKNVLCRLFIVSTLLVPRSMPIFFFIVSISTNILCFKIRKMCDQFSSGFFFPGSSYSAAAAALLLLLVAWIRFAAPPFPPPPPPFRLSLPFWMGGERDLLRDKCTRVHINIENMKQFNFRNLSRKYVNKSLEWYCIYFTKTVTNYLC